MSELQQGTDGLYTLCIFGVDEHPDDEVQEIFGKFGEIGSYRRNKNNNNLVFIGYSTLEEATQCIKDMKNNEKLRVNPARRKPQGENADRNNGRNNDGDGFRGRDRDNDGFKGRDSDGFKGRDSDGFKGRDSDGFKGRDSDGFKGRNNDGFKGRDSDGFKGRDNDGFKRKDSDGFKGGDSGGFKGRDSGGFKGRNSEGFKGRNNASGEDNQGGKERVDASKIPPMPPLTFDPPPAEVPEGLKPTVAKTVIMGHIHPKLKQSNIYELCQSASVHPLHVAMKRIIRPPNPTVHYAHVCVKGEDDVTKLCQALDTLKINGYELIVKPADTLIEEA